MAAGTSPKRSIGPVVLGNDTDSDDDVPIFARLAKISAKQESPSRSTVPRPSTDITSAARPPVSANSSNRSPSRLSRQSNHQEAADHSRSSPQRSGNAKAFLASFKSKWKNGSGPTPSEKASTASGDAGRPSMSVESSPNRRLSLSQDKAGQPRLNMFFSRSASVPAVPSAESKLASPDAETLPAALAALPTPVAPTPAQQNTILSGLTASLFPGGASRRGAAQNVQQQSQPKPLISLKRKSISAVPSQAAPRPSGASDGSPVREFRPESEKGSHVPSSPTASSATPRPSSVASGVSSRLQYQTQPEGSTQHGRMASSDQELGTSFASSATDRPLNSTAAVNGSSTTVRTETPSFSEASFHSTRSSLDETFSPPPFEPEAYQQQQGPRVDARSGTSFSGAATAIQAATVTPQIANPPSQQLQPSAFYSHPHREGTSPPPNSPTMLFGADSQTSFGVINAPVSSYFEGRPIRPISSNTTGTESTRSGPSSAYVSLTTPSPTSNEDAADQVPVSAANTKDVATVASLDRSVSAEQLQALLLAKAVTSSRERAEVNEEEGMVVADRTATGSSQATVASAGSTPGGASSSPLSLSSSETISAPTAATGARAAGFTVGSSALAGVASTVVPSTAMKRLVGEDTEALVLAQRDSSQNSSTIPSSSPMTVSSSAGLSTPSPQQGKAAAPGAKAMAVTPPTVEDIIGLLPAGASAPAPALAPASVALAARLDRLSQGTSVAAIAKRHSDLMSAASSESDEEDEKGHLLHPSSAMALDGEDIDPEEVLSDATSIEERDFGAHVERAIMDYVVDLNPYPSDLHGFPVMETLEEVEEEDEYEEMYEGEEWDDEEEYEEVYGDEEQQAPLNEDSGGAIEEFGDSVVDDGEESKSDSALASPEVATVGVAAANSSQVAATTSPRSQRRRSLPRNNQDDDTDSPSTAPRTHPARSSSSPSTAPSTTAAGATLLFSGRSGRNRSQSPMADTNRLSWSSQHSAGSSSDDPEDGLPPVAAAASAAPAASVAPALSSSPIIWKGRKWSVKDEVKVGVSASPPSVAMRRLGSTESGRSGPVAEITATPSTPAAPAPAIVVMPPSPSVEDVAAQGQAVLETPSRDPAPVPPPRIDSAAPVSTSPVAPPRGESTDSSAVEVLVEEVQPVLKAAQGDAIGVESIRDSQIVADPTASGKAISEAMAAAATRLPTAPPPVSAAPLVPVITQSIVASSSADALPEDVVRKETTSEGTDAVVAAEKAAVIPPTKRKKQLLKRKPGEQESVTVPGAAKSTDQGDETRSRGTLKRRWSRPSKAKSVSGEEKTPPKFVLWLRKVTAKLFKRKKGAEDATSKMETEAQVGGSGERGILAERPEIVAPPAVDAPSVPETARSLPRAIDTVVVEAEQQKSRVTVPMTPVSAVPSRDIEPSSSLPLSIPESSMTAVATEPATETGVTSPISEYTVPEAKWEVEESAKDSSIPDPPATDAPRPLGLEVYTAGMIVPSSGSQPQSPASASADDVPLGALGLTTASQAQSSDGKSFVSLLSVAKRTSKDEYNRPSGDSAVSGAAPSSPKSKKSSTMEGLKKRLTRRMSKDALPSSSASISDLPSATKSIRSEESIETGHAASIDQGEDSAPRASIAFLSLPPLDFVVDPSADAAAATASPHLSSKRSFVSSNTGEAVSPRDDNFPLAGFYRSTRRKNSMTSLRAVQSVAESRLDMLTEGSGDSEDEDKDVGGLLGLSLPVEWRRRRPYVPTGGESAGSIGILRPPSTYPRTPPRFEFGAVPSTGAASFTSSASPTPTTTGQLPSRQPSIRGAPTSSFFDAPLNPPSRPLSRSGTLTREPGLVRRASSRSIKNVTFVTSELERLYRDIFDSSKSLADLASLHNKKDEADVVNSLLDGVIGSEMTGTQADDARSIVESVLTAKSGGLLSFGAGGGATQGTPPLSPTANRRPTSVVLPQPQQITLPWARRGLLMKEPVVVTVGPGGSNRLSVSSTGTDQTHSLSQQQGSMGRAQPPSPNSFTSGRGLPSRAATSAGFGDARAGQVNRAATSYMPSTKDRDGAPPSPPSPTLLAEAGDAMLGLAFLDMAQKESA
ncbi:hypothetical protein HDU96_006052 [Phlyctochytrium bullatum]|nr:hypothetical protein HDU96_006052 [Phlyctochytrium bullatum]